MPDNCGNNNVVTFQNKTAIITDCGDTSNSSSSDCNDCRYVFNATNPTLVWVIIHPLNSFPSVTIVDDTGSKIEAGIKFVSPSRIEIHFTTAESGKAYLN